MQGIMFNDLHTDPFVTARSEREKCIDEVYKYPGVSTERIARTLGIDIATAHQHLAEAERLEDVEIVPLPRRRTCGREKWQWRPVRRGD